LLCRDLVDPGGVVAWVESGANLEGLFGAPAGEGLDRRRWAAGCLKGVREAGAEASETLLVDLGLGEDLYQQVFEKEVGGGMRHKSHHTGLLR
jgi:hypothetical protein